MPGGRPTIRSRQVAAELRKLRLDAGLTTGEAGKRLGVSQSKISRIETGALGLKPDEVAAMLGLYHVPVDRREEIMDLVRHAEEPGWWQAYGERLSKDWKTLIELESTASAMLNYQPLMLPGLVQTPEHARHIIRGVSERDLSDVELETLVAARMARQGILGKPHAPNLHVLLYEPALRIQVGGPDALRRQLRYLAELAQRPNITVQVVPLSAGVHPGIEGAFMIMEFVGEPTLIYLENRVSSIFLEEDRHIDAYRVAWQRILTVALSPVDSTEFIQSAAAELD
jgi:transcriptional regulator with XRE-family HTH domain